MTALAHFFDSSGYARLHRPLPEQLVDRMLSVIDYHFEHSIGPLRVNSRGEPSRLDSLIERDPVFLEALRHEPVSDALKQVLGPSVDVIHTRHNHATLNRAGDIPFRLHRDVQQWSQPLVSVFFYLEPATVSNGCTTIVPASHRLPYAGRQSQNGGGNWADEHPEYANLVGQELSIEMSKGGVLLLNSLCFHSVGNNNSKSTRKSVVFACRSSNELSAVVDPSVTLLFGSRRFIGNAALGVSGSLRQGRRLRGTSHI
ncbi:phytanoyl-CoA dioxygenase family protein [Nocardia abscessus]|uniref:phytanoyl-CoA dioxygenase family protein n=1 Tax=Nocardia abscessus TaxID=120957 RepID=UPI000A05BCA5|nr:phytanoyl-CoA dioxygenase family protein [Nocardia abscessus]